MRTKKPVAIFTIGVFGFDSEFGDAAEAAFFQALTDNHIDLFIDTRLRRGFMYGAYPYASKTRLIEKLTALGIGYAHLKDELAPTREIKDLPSDPDAPEKLSREYVRRYNHEILGIDADGRPTESALNAEVLWARARELAKRPDAIRPLLFCVEAEPQACHRSLAASALARQFNVEVIDLVASSAARRWRTDYSDQHARIN